MEKDNLELLEKCELCPRRCKVNRLNGEKGRCRASAKAKIALASLHFYEEPCISGKEGSGTVFFSGCNLSCKFCQNYEISSLGHGEEYEIEDLANMFLALQAKGANNINLVTGFAFVPHIIEALKIARKNGLDLPVVYNSSGYENEETIELLNGYVDIYLPDLKYGFSELSKKLSDCEDYFDIAKNAILKMIDQVGTPIFDKNGLIKKGVIVRHLILPNHVQNSKKVLKWIQNNLPKDIYVSIMAQYFPSYKAMEYEDINRKINENELEEIKNYIEELGITNGYIQDIEENEEQYVPDFK